MLSLRSSVLLASRRALSTSARTGQHLAGTPELFQKHVVDGSKPVLVDFYADWCGPCKMISPVLEKVVTEESGFDLMKVDTDAEYELAAKYKIRSLPTIMAFKNGQVIGQFIGAQPEAGVRKFLEEMKTK
ncbi:hypothetical protein JCM10212_002956 [Sporobolomyces blumeae]